MNIQRINWLFSRFLKVMAVFVAVVCFAISGFVLAEEIFDRAVMVGPEFERELFVPVDRAEEALFGAQWMHSGAIDFNLRTPSGTLITPAFALTDPGMEYYADQEALNPEGAPDLVRHRRRYLLTDPEPGVWRILLTGGGDLPTGGTRVELIVALETDLALWGWVEPEMVPLGQEAIINAGVFRSETALADITVQGTVFLPDGTPEAVAFFDDGLHGDGEAGNGLYGAVFSQTVLPGEYEVVISASGVNEFGDQFRRAGGLGFQVAYPAAFLTGLLGEEALADEPYSALKAVIGLEVLEQGTFLLSGTLRPGGSEETIALENFYGQLDPGLSEIELLFSGRAIGDSLLDGPYRITDLLVMKEEEVFLEEGVTDIAIYFVDQDPGPYYTAPYEYRSFEFTDIDNDGLPDNWEYQYFGDLALDGEGDHDGDGFSNMEEYLAGSDPTDLDSYPVLATPIPPAATPTPTPEG